MTTESNILYRGMNEEMYNKLGRKLTPRGKITRAAVYPSDNLFPAENLVVGESSKTAIDKHQNPKRYDEGRLKENSAYLSTTPHRNRALHYATKGNKESGYIFYINRSKLKELNVSEHSVLKNATVVTVPEDEEVLLLTNPQGSSLPEQAILKIEKVAP